MTPPKKTDDQPDAERQSEPEIEVEQPQDLDVPGEDADDVRGGACG